MEPEAIQRLANEVHRGFMDDEESRTEWLDQHTFWLSLYMQNDYAENSDAERSWGATESVPILTEASNQFQSRTYKTFFPNDTFVSAIPMRRTAQDRTALEERADRVGKHMSYQLSFLDRDYRKDKDGLFLGVAIHGSFFTKTYPKSVKKHPKYIPFKVDNVRPTDLVINYTCGPIRIEDVRRKTHVIHTTVGETEALEKEGFFVESAKAYKSQGKNIYDVKVDEVNGLTEGGNQSKGYAPALIIEQHSFYKLGDDEDYLPYIVTLDMASRKILRVVIGWEADANGKAVNDYDQLQYFTHFKFSENPDGFYGLGLGHFIGDLNSAVNIMLRQTMDAATLANDGNMSGFVSERLGIEGDEVRMVLGKLRKIPDTVGDLQNAMMLMKFPGPNAALIQIMELMDARAQRMSSTTEATTGSIEKNMQPTTVLSQVEQAMEMFSSVQMRLANALGDELNKIYRINQRFLPLIDYFTVNNVPDQVIRADYADDMLIQPIFDPKFATQTQKVARAQAELQGTLQNPNSQQRPQVIDEAYRRYFKALDIEDIDKLVPPQIEPANVDNQDWENVQFLMPPGSGAPFDVFQEQDHLKHLKVLHDFVSDHGEKIPPENQQAILAHKQKHEAYLYGQTKGVIPPHQTGQESASSMVQGAGDPMGAGTDGGPLQGMAFDPSSLFGAGTGGIQQAFGRAGSA